VIGSPGLVQTLIGHDLVDELQLMIDPLVVGGGKRLLGDDGALRPLRLVGSQVPSTGAIIVTYASAGPTSRCREAGPLRSRRQAGDPNREALFRPAVWLKLLVGDDPLPGRRHRDHRSLHDAIGGRDSGRGRPPGRVGGRGQCQRQRGGGQWGQVSEAASHRLHDGAAAIP